MDIDIYDFLRDLMNRLEDVAASFERSAKAIEASVEKLDHPIFVTIYQVGHTLDSKDMTKIVARYRKTE